MEFSTPVACLLLNKTHQCRGRQSVCWYLAFSGLFALQRMDWMVSGSGGDSN